MTRARIVRLIGGAGTGKTSALLRVLDDAKEMSFGDPFALGFASYTRTAREEAATRAAASWGVEASLLQTGGWFRTVHSVAFRCVGVEQGQLVTDAPADIDWISQAMGTGIGVAFDKEDASVAFIGDDVASEALNAWQMARVTMRSLREVVEERNRIDYGSAGFEEVLQAVEIYERAKRIDGRLDFTDLLMQFGGVSNTPDSGVTLYESRVDMPRDISTWIFDEAQDNSALIDICCRRLISSESCDLVYIAGDPFQSIHGWNGADYRQMMSWEVDEEVIMPKSWRCPELILEMGESFLRMMSEGYFDRGIKPVSDGGVIEYVSSIMETNITPDKDVLVLSRTRNEVLRMTDELKNAGIPYTSTTSKGGVPKAKCAMAALYKLQNGKECSGSDFAKAVDLLPANPAIGRCLAHGTKKRWSETSLKDEYDFMFLEDVPEVGGTQLLRDLIASGEWASLIDGGVDWVHSADRFGVELTNAPMVRVGTIHSSKGMEADEVVFNTTVSRFIHDRRSLDPRMRDEELRISYVAATRAKTALTMIADGRYTMEMP